MFFCSVFSYHHEQHGLTQFLPTRRSADLPATGEMAAGADSVAAASQGTRPERRDAVEKAILIAELRRNGGSLKATYESLGLSRKTLYDKLQRHGLQREDFLVSEEG